MLHNFEIVSFGFRWFPEEIRFFFSEKFLWESHYQLHREFEYSLPFKSNLN